MENSDVIPNVDYRFGDKWLITDFITPNHFDIVAAAESLAVADDYVQNVAHYVCDNFEYPMNYGRPCCCGQLVRYRRGFFRYKFRERRRYIWALPCEVMQSGFGFCAETGNLAESLLRAGGKTGAWACLGEVRDLSDNLLGLHEWVRCSWKHDRYVMETTIHEPGIATMVPASSVYDKNSSFAQKAGIYYVERAYFNEKEYHEPGANGGMSVVKLMSFPPPALLHMGLGPPRMTPKVASDWCRYEWLKQTAIRRGFSYAHT